MNQHPDINTTAGKIAVMQAFEKYKRVLENGALCEDPKWNWRHNNYTIHPADLNPKELKPWKLEPQHIGKVLKRKDDHGYSMITGSVTDQFVLSDRYYKPEELLMHFTCLDGSPCGQSE